MRKLYLLIAAIAFIAILAVGTFFYITRDIAAPSQTVDSSVQQLESSSDATGEVVYRISQDESQVEYNIFEVLNGSDKTVVGVTNQIAGDILINLTTPAETQLGEISINARTFATDSDRRDNSVARFVLQSEDAANEFITFQPTALSGLPASISIGDTLELQVTGDLTVAGVTHTVTFAVTAVLESEQQLTGHAEATVALSDFNITIPQVPQVANVGETVTLKLDFTAYAVTDTTAT